MIQAPGRDFTPQWREDIVHAREKELDSVSKQREKIPKARELEDVYPRPRFRITRQSSLTSLTGLSEKAELEKKSSHLWKCISRRPNKLGGYIYRFQMREEYTHSKEAIEKKNREIYPAVEIGSFDLDKYPVFDRNLSVDSFEDPTNFTIIRTFQKLGYDMTESFLELPDRDALLINWENLREQDENLPKLEIKESEGIADDRSFVENFFTHHATLSSGIEFVHDHTVHIMVLVKMTIRFTHPQNPEFEKERARIVKVFAKEYRITEISRRMLEEGRVKTGGDLIKRNLNKFEAALGALVDHFSSVSDDYSKLEGIHDQVMKRQMKTIWDDSSWAEYFEKRFGKGNVDKSQLNHIRFYMETLVELFEHQRKTRKRTYSNL